MIVGHLSVILSSFTKHILNINILCLYGYTKHSTLDLIAFVISVFIYCTKNF